LAFVTNLRPRGKIEKDNCTFIEVVGIELKEFPGIKKKWVRFVLITSTIRFLKGCASHLNNKYGQ